MDVGLIVDLETTGLEPSKDKIIEIGLVEFGLNDGKDPVLLGMYGGLEDPGVPLTGEIQSLTGLTDEALRGQVIRWDLVREAWDRASVIVAHNAQFDRSFLMVRPDFAKSAKHWACTMRHIDWASKGFGSRKLQYLAADHGFVNPFAHRAVFDCATTFRLSAPHVRELINNSYEPEFKVIAVGSPFETKDILKRRGYQWDADGRVWHKTVLGVNIQGERDFLGTEVYRGPSRHAEEKIWFNPKL